MRLICHPLVENMPTIRPAPGERQWMDETPDSYAYRCLPLAIANSHGWEVLNPAPFEVYWTGGPNIEDLTVTGLSNHQPIAMSHFGCGVLTFEIGCLLRTPPGYNLYVTGPVNQPKDGIAALTGVIETDWSPYSFTMNWLMTRPKHVVYFNRNEPIAHFFPISRDTVDRMEPEVRPLHSDLELYQSYATWRDGRMNFNQDLLDPMSTATKAKWQKAYFRGMRPDGTPGTETHKTKLRPKPFSKLE